MDIDALFDRLYPPLHRYLYRLTGDSDVAEDVAQESFVRLLKQELPEEEARPWLFTVATNLVRDRARKRSRHRRLSVDVPKPSPPERPDGRVERTDRVRRVREVLDELPDRDRTLLLMREEGFKYDEIAEAIGVAPGSVGTLLARALRRFERAYRTVHDVEEAEVNDARG